MLVSGFVSTYLLHVVVNLELCHRPVLIFYEECVQHLMTIGHIKNFLSLQYYIIFTSVILDFKKNIIVVVVIHR